MGWLFCEPTRDALVRRLKDRCNNDSYELIDSATRGNEFYAVLRRKDTGLRFIAVCLMRGTPGNFHPDDIRWGYKDMDESMGPCYYNCPERLLAQSDDQSEYAVGWRAACRHLRARRNVHAKFIRGLKAGDKVRLGDIEATFVRRLEGRMAANLVCDSVRGRFRYKPSQVQELRT